MEYASRGVANTALGLGIAGAVGTAAGLLGDLGGLFGPRQPSDPGDRPVTRYDMDLFQTINAKNVEIAKLEGMRYTDGAVVGLQNQISQQAVWNATQTGVMNLLQAQIAQLQGMTKMYIPESSISPAPVTVSNTNSGN